MRDDPKKQSIEFEPQFRKDHFVADPSEKKAGRILSRQKHDPDQDVENSVWDEPGLSAELAGGSSGSRLTYSGWLAGKIDTTSSQKTWLNTLFLVMFSGLWAVIGVFILSFQGQGGIGVLAVVLFGPIIEEILKISSALVTIEKRLYLFKSGIQIVVCCVMSGLVFAFVENLLYLNFYIPDPSEMIVLWRWTVCVLLHSGCAGISSIGLLKVWQRTMREGRKPELGSMTRYVTAACVVHGTYNLAAILFDSFFLAKG